MSLTTLRFGINVHTSMRPGSGPVGEALDAERLGLDVLTVHRDVPHGSDPSFEVWTLLTWLAAHTTRIRVAPNVLAKMAETLDRLSGGRLLLALGSGAAMNEPAFGALGLTQRSPREKVEALEAAIEIMRGLWSASGFSYAGRHFRTEAATIEPKPGQGRPGVPSSVPADSRTVESGPMACPRRRCPPGRPAARYRQPRPALSAGAGGTGHTAWP